jgi:ubiquinone/menaquinone biosynthesis C-methylase UbiE
MQSISNVDVNIYRKYNSDLQKMNDEEILDHFNIFGRLENRIYNVTTLIESNNIHLKYFNLEYYIENNKDLFFENKCDYVIDYLDNRLNDNRKISKELSDFKEMKRNKFVDKLTHIKEDLCYLKDEDKQNYKIGVCETESANEWGEDSDISDLISKNELVLNIGAGYRLCKERYYSLKNVINTEIFSYPTTDIVCDGDNLPFKDNSFDVVLSLAVLEHVKNPWKHADEMIRVLKPGGVIYADVPFLQPYHGYPHHYYNMTTAGLRNLFDKKINIIKHQVEPWSKPIFTLTWFLSKYCEFLDEKTREKFSNLTVMEIIKNGTSSDLDYVNNMDKSKEEIIACATTLIGKKI